MNGINLNGFAVRSFMVKGLTAKWGIGENRVPPIWDTNLIGYWDARGLPNGAVSKVANKATLATKAPDLMVTGATMVDGTLQFDGVDDRATTAAFMFPEKFTIFWDIDWLGNANKAAGISHISDFQLWNIAAQQLIRFHLKTSASNAQYPNSVVGISTAKLVYDKTGRARAYTADVGMNSQNTLLRVGVNGSRQFYTKLGFRQLLIFNKELSQAEVNEVLTTMFPA